MENTKQYRVLEIFFRGLRGEDISVQGLANEYEVSTKSITRSINELKDFLADHRELVGNTDTEGELKKSKISLSFRFVHCKEGHDCKSNICLRHYYKARIPLTLEIYVLPNTRPAQKVEAKLRWQFLEKYAALPIADGASYKKQSKEM